MLKLRKIRAYIEDSGANPPSDIIVEDAPAPILFDAYDNPFSLARAIGFTAGEFYVDFLDEMIDATDRDETSDEPL